MMRRAWIITLLLVAAWSVRTALIARHPVSYDRSLSTFPNVVGNWTGHDVRLDPEILSQIRVDDYLNRYYRSDVGVMGLYVAYYASQKEGDAVHSPMNCLPGSGWQPVTTERIALDAPAGDPADTVNKVVVVKGLDQQLVLYWYQTLDRVVASEYVSKAFLVRDAFRSGRTDIALVRIVAPINSQRPDGVAMALSVARPFAERVLPEIRRRLFRS
jgi:EpsI family protein